MVSELKIFATRLRALRKEQKITQEELAHKIGCSPALISFYETMLREPGLTNIIALCKVFGVSPDYLMGLTDERGR